MAEDWPALVDPAAVPGGPYDPVAVAAACGAARSYCGWHIAPAIAETLTVDGSGGPVQLLPTLRLAEVISVTDRGAAVDDPEWSAAGMLRRPYGCWTSRMRGVVAKVEHGFTQAPAELLVVIASMASRGVTATDVRRQTAGPFTVEYGDGASSGAVGMTGEERAVLDRYRLPPRP
ncbi:hypothetical protein [Lysinibacillus sp. NPDC056185]|uniref:hypothetical protein n=1 Tax=Lysinibacillus sp. NPDC056185 TaxID=3345739 RepID=UPI0039EF8DBD